MISGIMRCPFTTRYQGGKNPNNVFNVYRVFFSRNTKREKENKGNQPAIGSNPLRKPKL